VSITYLIHTAFAAESLIISCRITILMNDDFVDFLPPFNQ
jgi:hypothetical protein